MATFYVRTTGGAMNTASSFSQDPVLKATGAASATLPTNADDVSFESNSGSMTGWSFVCFNLIFQTGYAGTFAIQASQNYGIYGDMTCNSTVVFTNTTVGTFNFNNGTTVQNLTTAGRTLPAIIINGAGLNQLDAITSANTISLNLGVWNTNNFNVNAVSFLTGTGVKTFNLGTSTLTSTNGTFSLNGTNTTLNAASATLITQATGTQTLSFPTTAVVGTLTCSSLLNCTLGGTFTVGTFTRSTNTLGAATFLNGTMTVNGVATIGGTAAFYHLIASASYGSSRTISLGTTGSIAGSYRNWEWITVTGTNTPVTGTLEGDASSNTGITFTASQTLYRVGSSAMNWEDTTAWAATSGGAATARIPLASDDVVVDANSPTFIGLPNASTVRMCRAFTVTKSAITIGSASVRGMYILGDFNVSAGVTWGTGVSITFRRASAGLSRNITTNGSPFTASVTFDTLGGQTCVLTDTIVCSGTAGVAHNSGIVDFSNKTITCNAIASNTSTARTLNVSGATLNLNGTSTILQLAFTGMTFTTTTATTINVLDATTATKSLNTSSVASSAQVNWLSGSLGTLQMITAGVAGKLVVRGTGKTVIFVSSNTTGSTSNSLTDLDILGDAPGAINLRSTVLGTTATIARSTQFTQVKNVVIQDLTCTGFTPQIATDSSGTTNYAGWAFYYTLAASGTITNTGSASIGNYNAISADGVTSDIGSADVTDTLVISATGSVSDTGSAGIVNKSTVSASGTVSDTGTASVIDKMAISATGSTSDTGTAALVNKLVMSASGTVTDTGSALVGISSSLSASGSIADTGTASLVNLAKVSATGQIICTGSAALALISGIVPGQVGVAVNGVYQQVPVLKYNTATGVWDTLQAYVYSNAQGTWVPTG